MDVLNRLDLIEGVMSLPWNESKDGRGSFAKIIDASFFDFEAGFVVREVFFNRSSKGVVRGMHLQWPPADHGKLICCMEGSFFDALVDLRAESPTFMRVASQNLIRGDRVYVPRGVAHGFQSLEDDSIMFYATTSAHDPRHDGGVHPLSCGVVWPLSTPVISIRDQSLPRLSEIETPFQGKSWL